MNPPASNLVEQPPAAVTRLDSDGDDPTFLATWADAQFYKAGNGGK